MTAMDRPTDVDVEEATVDDLRRAVDRALDTEGITLAELRREADSRHFTTLGRRLAWTVASALGGAATPRA